MDDSFSSTAGSSSNELTLGVSYIQSNSLRGTHRVAEQCSRHSRQENPAKYDFITRSKCFRRCVRFHSFSVCVRVSARVVNAKCALKMEFFHGGKIPSKNDAIKIPHIGVTVVVRRDLEER